MLSTFCHKNQDQWDVFLPQVLMAYRSSVHSSTGQMPNAMMLGREITIPLRAVIPEPVNSNAGDVDGENYVTTLKKKLHQIHKLGRENLKRTHCTKRNIMTLEQRKSVTKKDRQYGFMILQEK